MAFDYELDEVQLQFSSLLHTVKAMAFSIVRAAGVSIYTLHGRMGMGSFIVVFSLFLHTRLMRQTKSCDGDLIWNGHGYSGSISA